MNQYVLVGGGRGDKGHSGRSNKKKFMSSLPSPCLLDFLGRLRNLWNVNGFIYYIRLFYINHLWGVRFVVVVAVALEEVWPQT